jgi:copper chaperone CopZ
MQSVRYFIPNISCDHCTHRIITRLNQIPGIEDVEASVETKEVHVDFDTPATEEDIISALMEINYPPVQ